MASTTARGGLIKPTDAESADVAVFNANLDAISLYAMGGFICTSTTRPASPWLGMRIFETDTKATGTWDGTQWAMFDTIWQTYTPVIKLGATVMSTIGNGYLKGKYFRSGKMVKVDLAFQLGTTTAYGAAGTLSISLPPGILAAANIDTAFNGLVRPIGTWRGNSTGVFHGIVGGATADLVGVFFLITTPTASSDLFVSDGTFTANGHYLTATLTYQAI